MTRIKQAAAWVRANKAKFMMYLFGYVIHNMIVLAVF